MATKKNPVAHILMCADSGYFQHIAACLVSLVDHNVDIEFSVVVLATTTTDEMNEKLQSSLAQYENLTLRIEKFDAPGFADLPLTNPDYPIEIYARFWAVDYFPQSVDRILYLDGDMVIIDSIKPLLDLDLEGKMLAAAQIPGSTSPLRLGYSPEFGYFNSGVMVINLKKWREEKVRDTLIKTSHVLAKLLNDPDQDVLNYCFHDQYISLDYTWNAISPFYKEVNTLVLSKDEIRRVANEARIVHFNGSAKPWNYLSFHPHTKEYLRCVSKTEWRGFVPKDYSALNVVKKRIIQVFGEKRIGQAMATVRKFRKNNFATNQAVYSEEAPESATNF